MKQSEESVLRTSLIKMMFKWWDSELPENVRLPLIGDATLIYMAEQALGVLLAIDDVQTLLQENEHMVQKG